MAALKSTSQEQWKILQGNGNWQPPAKDKRFKDPLWRENRYFRTLLQSYLSSNQGLRDWIDEIGLEGVESKRVELLEGGLAPSNFLLSNPEGLKRSRESKGKSILKGLKNLFTDLKDNRGMPSQSDPAKFELGRNIAYLPGAVVYRNELIELIQYTPSTAKVYQRPIFFSTRFQIPSASQVRLLT